MRVLPHLEPVGRATRLGPSRRRLRVLDPQSMKLPLFILVSVLVLVLSFGGCGGEKTVTRGEWIAQAETICSRAAAAMDKLDPNAFKSQSEFVRSVNEAWDDYLEELHALATPPEYAAAIAEWLDLLTKLADAWRVFLVSDGGPKATQTFQRAAFPTQTRADRVIRGLGAARCAVD